MDKQTGELALAALERAREAIGTAEAALRQAMASPAPQKATKGKGEKKTRFHVAESLSAHLLGPTPNVNDEDWPQAVSPFMIVRTDIEKQFRAVQIVGLIPMALEGMNVLDCGCGEGQIAGEVAARAKRVTAYDPFCDQDKWQDKPNLLFTNNLDVVQERGPYDAILLYDVIDHLEGESPATFLATMGKLLAPNGRVFMRAHPWTSKHGSHLYETNLNKAYAHLALTPDELVIAGFDVKPNLRIVRPMAAYEQFAKTAGLKVLDRKGHNDPVEPYFSGELLDRIIGVTWKGEIAPEDALKIMSNSLIDYILGNG